MVECRPAGSRGVDNVVGLLSLTAFRATDEDLLVKPRLSSDPTRRGRATPGGGASKPLKSTIFRRAFDRRPAAEKILSKFDMFSDSFVLAADKSRISLTTF